MRAVLGDHRERPLRRPSRPQFCSGRRNQCEVPKSSAGGLSGGRDVWPALLQNIEQERDPACWWVAALSFSACPGVNVRVKTRPQSSAPEAKTAPLPASPPELARFPRAQQHAVAVAESRPWASSALQTAAAAAASAGPVTATPSDGVSSTAAKGQGDQYHAMAPQYGSRLTM